MEPSQIDQKVNTMNITLSQFRFIKSRYIVSSTHKINELGGSFDAMDLNGNLFKVDYFHGKHICYGGVRKAWISYSKTNKVVI